MKVGIGSDHAGYKLKCEIIKFLKEKNYDVTDFGTHSTDSVDYPDYALRVALAVQKGLVDAGIFIDGAGIGSAMVANKVPGIRAAVCNDLYTAKNSREHNFANFLTMGSMVIGEGLAKQIVELWLTTPWGSGRHERRVNKIMNIEASFIQGNSQQININLDTNNDNNKPGIKFLSEDIVKEILNRGETTIKIAPKCIITPLAMDLIKENKIELIK